MKSYISILLIVIAWELVKLAWDIVLRVLFTSIRDTYRTLRHAELEEGYGWYSWLWIVPYCWWYRLKQQAWSYRHGIETEVM